MRTETSKRFTTLDYAYDAECGLCSPYSPGWCEAWTELLNVDCKAALSLRRRVARNWQEGRQRIRVSVFTSYGSADGDYAVTHDSVDAFGWRAALKAARVFRDEYEIRRYSQVRLSITDARIEDLLDSAE